ncbi:PLP-dependent cysteine synthase family protein [Mucilaginibacter mali]|uniref:cysteine synthase n=1 Tax=Mucilaginibacter mali TaxID=2740462 RepID=A0A7D4QNY0_9SPHI|nr:PLP-dependent cysteine synthase family protein [Mucilaginibacter mali]QKJ32850.1 PLP-dependent cysteine synthase family protein [Mucilaginibacter mali]
MTIVSTKHTLKQKIDGLWLQVGNTPMLEITYTYQDGAPQTILVKDEHYSPTGSIKDRMALYILQKAYENGTIKAGDKIVEATSGNTGIAFAAIGRMLGHPVKIIMPDWLSQERMDIITSLGAEIQLISAADGGFKRCIQVAETLQHDERMFLPRQFENSLNAEAHEKTTGREIANQLLLLNIKKPYAFIAGVGTGGTIMGAGKQLKKLFPAIKLHPLEPAESPTLTTGYKNGKHRIQGISDEFIPAILDLAMLDKIIQVNDGDAILMAQKLGKDLGLGVGISSGANLVGAIKVQKGGGEGQTVITVFPDSNKKYLSTDLMKEEPVKLGYLSPDIRLLHCRIVNK